LTTQNTIIIGVDPGFTGAIAFLGDTRLIIHDLPLTMYMNRAQIDPYKFSDIVCSKKTGIRFAVVEDVSAMPGQGVTSMFRFGYNAGILLGVLAAHNIKVLKIKPSVWKPALGLSRRKKDSRDLASKIFPDNAESFTRVKDDGRAEAALIAHFAKISI